MLQSHYNLTADWEYMSVLKKKYLLVNSYMMRNKEENLIHRWHSHYTISHQATEGSEVS